MTAKRKAQKSARLEKRLRTALLEDAQGKQGAMPDIQPIDPGVLNWLPPADHELREDELKVFELLPVARFNPATAYQMAYPVSPSVARLEGARIASLTRFREAVKHANKQVHDVQGGQFVSAAIALAFGIMTDPSQDEELRLKAMEKGMKALHGGMPKQHQHLHGADQTMKDIFAGLGDAINKLSDEPERMEYHGEVIEARFSLPDPEEA